MKPDIKQRIEQIRRGEVPEGYKKTKAGIMPREWEEKKLKEITSQNSQKVGNLKLETLSITAGKGFVNQARKFGKELSGKQYVNYTVLRKGEFAYNKGNSKKYPQGCIYMLEDREIAAVPNVFNCFAFINQHNKFFYHLFNWGFLNKQLFKLINSGVRNDGLLNLYDDDFYSCFVIIPPLPEQHKIADILSTQDRVIELKEQLLAQKQQQKKYLMQQLLTGKKRLPGFNGEWRRIKLGDFIQEIDERTICNNQHEILSVTKNGIVRQSEHFNKQIASENNIGYKVIRKGNLAFSTMNLWMGSLDVLSSCDVGIVSPAYKVFKLNKKFITVDFAKNFMKSSEMVCLYKSKSEQGASIVRRNLDLKALLDTEVFLPYTSEQTAIADVLSAADREIDLLRQNIESEKQKKKALMQLLLTGIVRVSV